MADTTKLLNGLKEYRKSLDKHARTMQSEHSKLNARWSSLQRVYEGRAASDFKAHWRKTDQVFKDYMAASQRVRKLLDERITALEIADRAGL